MNYIDLKYASIISTRLERFKLKKTSPYRANFRCPICGDSHKDKRKTRGWLLEHENKLFYYCHNCGASETLYKFLSHFDPVLANEYLVDRKLDGDTRVSPAPIKQEVKESTVKNPLSTIKKISALKPDHPARLYINDRLIPTNQHYRLYYAPKFNKWVNTLGVPDLDKLNEKYDEPRLVIPFFDKYKKVFGFAGRSFNPNSKLRYITIMLDNKHHKVFGMEQVDTSKPYYILEGQIDSLFVDNSVAMAGADGSNTELPNPENAVYVFDNEPRNKTIIATMEKVIKRGNKIVVWPTNIPEKDINQMVMSGNTKETIMSILKSRTLSGLEAELALADWRISK